MNTSLNHASSENAKPSKRRRFRFSLRRLMLAMLVFGCLMGYVVRMYRQDTRRRTINQKLVVLKDDREWVIAFNLRNRPWYAVLLGYIAPLPREVKASNANMSDNDLAVLNELRQLESLELKGFRLSDDGIAHLAPLKNLRFLRFLTNDNTFGFRRFDKNTGKVVVARTKTVTDAGLVHIAGLKKLELLDLDSEEITDEGLKQFRGLTELESLSLSSPEITDDGLAHLAGLKKLRILSLKETQISGPGLNCLVSLPDLQELSLAGSSPHELYWMKNQATSSKRSGELLEGIRIDDDGMLHLQKLTGLRALSLDYTPITDKGLERLRTLSQLKMLTIVGTKITDDGLSHLKSFSRLEELDIHDNAITDVGFSHLVALRNLKKLCIDDLEFSDVGLAHLCELNQLEELGLGERAITVQELEQLKKMRQLKQLVFNATLLGGSRVKDLARELPKCTIYATLRGSLQVEYPKEK